MRSATALLRTALLYSLLDGFVAPVGAQEIRNVALVTFEDDGRPVTVASDPAVLTRAQFHIFRATGFVFNAKTGEPVNGVRPMASASVR